MLQSEHSAILLICIKLPFVINTFVLSTFEWPFYTGFTVEPKRWHADWSFIFNIISTHTLFFELCMLLSTWIIPLISKSYGYWQVTKKNKSGYKGRQILRLTRTGISSYPACYKIPSQSKLYTWRLKAGNGGEVFLDIGLEFDLEFDLESDVPGSCCKSSVIFLVYVHWVMCLKNYMYFD